MIVLAKLPKKMSYYNTVFYAMLFFIQSSPLCQSEFHLTVEFFIQRLFIYLPVRFQSCSAMGFSSALQ